MTRKVISVTPETSVRTTAKLMADNKISGVPVVDDKGNLVGMVTEADLLRGRKEAADREESWLTMLADGEGLAPDFVNYVRTQNNMVRVVMHHDVASIAENTPLSEVAQDMVDKGVKRLPVVADGKLVGIVSRADLIRALGARRG